MMQNLAGSLGNKNFVFIADKGMLGGMNVAQIILDDNCHVINSSARKAESEMRNYILDQQGYTELHNGSLK